MPINLGLGEVLIVLVVALLVFGGRLPEVGRSLGKGLVSFKEGLKGIPDSDTEDSDAGDSDAEAPDEESGGEPDEAETIEDEDATPRRSP